MRRKRMSRSGSARRVFGSSLLLRRSSVAIFIRNESITPGSTSPMKAVSRRSARSTSSLDVRVHSRAPPPPRRVSRRGSSSNASRRRATRGCVPHGRWVVGVTVLWDGRARPILLAVSDNGPQMTSGSTREFLALCAIAQHFGRPGTPTDQAWIESLNGHLKSEYPHLLAIPDPATLRAELKIVRAHYNGVRLHQNIGYVTPNDEHERRGEAIRKQRQAGLEQARLRRLAWHRQHRHDQPIKDPDDVG
jgi:putative transposase